MHVFSQVCDFGFSVHLPLNQSHVSNTRRGTPFYVAPEVRLISWTYTWPCVLLLIEAFQTDSSEYVWTCGQVGLTTWLLGMDCPSGLDGVVVCVGTYSLLIAC